MTPSPPAGFGPSSVSASGADLAISRKVDRSAGREGLLRTAAFLGGLSLFSRLLGLARDMSMAWLLGGGAAADALVAAMRLPHVLRRLLGEGSLSMTLTASLTRLNGADGNVSLAAGAAEKTRLSPGPALRGMAAHDLTLSDLAKALAPRLGLILTLLTLLGLAAAPWLAAVLAPGFSGPELERTVSLLRICLPYLLAAGMAALGMALLHSMGIFWLPALSPALFNLAMLAFAVVAALSSWPPAPVLALGMLCGGLAQWLAQWLAVRRLLPAAAQKPDQSVLKHIGKKSADVPARKAAWRCLGRLPAGLAGAAAPQLAMLAAMGLASGLGQGQVAALYYAERLLELPLGLVGVCLGMASLPALSRLAAAGESALFAEHLGMAVRLTLLFSLPAAAGLWAVGPDLVEALLRHGAFDAHATRESGLALWAYLPGLPAFAVNRSLLAGCNALGEVRRTAVSAAWAVAATLAGGTVLVHTLPTAWQIMAPALAVSLGLWFQTLLLRRALRQAFGQWVQIRGAVCPLIRPGALLRQAAAATAAGLAAWALLPWARALGGLWLGLGAAIAAGTVAWALCLALCGDADLTVLRKALNRTRDGNKL